MPEHLECEVLQKVRYINTLTFTSVLRWSIQLWAWPITAGLTDENDDDDDDAILCLTLRCIKG